VSRLPVAALAALGLLAGPAQAAPAPGTLLASTTFTRGLPAGAHAWRIRYETRGIDGRPATATGLVVVGRGTTARPRPVIAWAHGTTGVASRCAPSRQADPLGAGAMPDIAQVLDRGWAIVATDYVGLGASPPHPYLVGRPEARSVLDAVRAARALSAARLAPKTVVWGHSQGGGAALWTGIVEPAYAPDVDLLGVAALAPASDLPALFGGGRYGPEGTIFGAYLLAGYGAAYPDVRPADYVVPRARALVRRIAGRCLAGSDEAAAVADAIAAGRAFSQSPAAGPLGRRLAQNVPLAPIRAPLLIGQGSADELVPRPIQDAYVRKLCARGQRLDYRTYAGESHAGLVLDPRSRLRADLLAWTAARFAGQPQARGCARR
jgi:pimeloyl-ACP methyl ester carboxylesterase